MSSYIQRVQSASGLDTSKSSRKPQATRGRVENSSLEEDLVTGRQIKPRSAPILESAYHDDPAFARILDLYLSPEIKKRAEGELSALADAAVSDQVMKWVGDAERHTVHIQNWDGFGEKRDELVTSQGWKHLWRFGISERYVCERTSSNYVLETETNGVVIDLRPCLPLTTNMKDMGE